MSDWTPETEPSGSLEPPRRYPPTAVGAMTPPPERDPFHAAAIARMQAAPALIRMLRPALRGLRNALKAVERTVARVR